MSSDEIGMRAQSVWDRFYDLSSIRARSRAAQKTQQRGAPDGESRAACRFRRSRRLGWKFRSSHRINPIAAERLIGLFL
jgi:hypothetical protein